MTKTSAQESDDAPDELDATYSESFPANWGRSAHLQAEVAPSDVTRRPGVSLAAGSPPPLRLQARSLTEDVPA